MIIEFGEWLPDIDAHENPGLVDCQNVIPSNGGYRSLPGPESRFGAGGAFTTRCTGLYSTPDAVSPEFDAIVGCDLTDIYLLTNGTKTNISGSAGVYTNGYHKKWSFTRFGDLVFATRFQANAIQYGNIRNIVYSSGKFADIPTPASGAFNAGTIATVGNFVVCGDLWNMTTTFWRNRIRWSAFESPTDFEPSVATQSDYQDLPDAGVVQAIVPIEESSDALIVTTNGIWYMNYVGGDKFFDIKKIKETGTPFRHSIISTPAGLVFINNDGVQLFRDGAITNLSRGRNEKWIKAIVDNKTDSTTDGHLEKFCVETDEERGLVFWSLPTIGQTDNNYLLVWNYVENRFSYFSYATEALRKITIYNATNNISSLFAFSSSHQLTSFTSTTGIMAPYFRTREFCFYPGFKSTLKRFRLLAKNLGSYFVYYRNGINETPLVTPEIDVSTGNGIAKTRITSYRHAISILCLGDIGLAKNLEIEVIRRGRRL